MRQTRILLLRHAETAAPDRFHGSESDIGLGERGIRQAQALVAALQPYQPAALISSAMLRARQTAAPLAAATGLTVQVEPMLHERSMGRLSGMARDLGLETYRESVRHWVAGDLDWTHPTGESYVQIRDRTVPILQQLAAMWLDHTIVVIAHGVVIRVLLATLLDGYTHADFDRIAIDNAALNDLTYHDDGHWTATALNQPIVESGEVFKW